MSETAPENQRPEWLPEKFKGPEDLAQSYGEAERRIQELQAQVEQERTQFGEALQNISQLQEQQQGQQTQQQYAPQDDPLLVNYQQAVDNGDARAMLAIQLELNRQMTAQAIQEGMKEFGTKLDRGAEVDREVALTMATERVSKGFENWDELAPEVGKLLQNNPQWMPQQPSVDGFTTAIQTAAKMVLADQIIAQQQSGEQKRVEKINAQGLQGDSGRTTIGADNTTWEDIAKIELGGYSGLMGRQRT